MEGKTVLITGSNAGIGYETAKNIAARGARVLMACRDPKKCKEAMRNILEELPNAKLVPLELNLASLTSVRECAKKVIQTESRLDVLINNAGIFCDERGLTEDGFELTMGVNHIGHFLLTILLLDLLKKTSPSRIVVVSSAVHACTRNMDFDNIMMEERYDGFYAYKQSKLANILFSRHLSKRLEGTGVTCNSLHPGYIFTNIISRVFDKNGFWNTMKYHFALPLIKLMMISVPEGAKTSVYCAVAPELENVSGKYFANCRVKAESPAAQRDDDATRLWNLSMEWTGLSKSP